MPRLGLACVSLLGLSACTGAPTYGTGTRADVQLIQDVSSIMTIAPTNKPAIDYKPRPEIVAPATTAVLPAPQDSIARSSAEWPETPEERRQKLRAEATANQDNPFYKSPIVATGLGQASPVRQQTSPFGESRGSASLASDDQAEQSSRFRAARAVQSGAYNERRFLSDPPSALKVPAETAPVGDLGEAERKKEARRLKEARKNKGFSVRNLWPW
ncbi:MAG: hypothetical protein HC779_02510 [Phyllobacteriaceae bacterium]|nr:hypothetical protein [Phyllobacteriaceae bacterium]